ncbi:MAG TPA: RluA family pseudouridine synthase [Terriglobales bacterium]|nr:RluA family pseudouridine synthase [Terriglobales bacterium]
MLQSPQSFTATADDAGKRLDQFLTGQLPEVSRVRVQQLIAQRKVRVDGGAAKASQRLRGGEHVEVLGEVKAAPLRAMAEDIPLDVVYEDDSLAVVNKPAGMMVHAGSGATEDARNRGTLVNALLHRFQALSGVGGELRPGIVHRLDKETSGLIVVAKNDVSHRKLARQFAGRAVKKTYLALVHGWPKQDRGTISDPISRDRKRRTRMTTRGSGGRAAVSHFKVLRRVESRFGKFALLEVQIETGRTHQIRVHLASIGHPVVGDTLYGAPREIRSKNGTLSLGRNFLHAGKLQLEHPRTGEALTFSRGLPEELERFLTEVEHRT